MSKKPPTVRKVQLSFPHDVYERFMKAVLAEVPKRGSMKGVMSACAVEAIELWLKQKEATPKRK